MANYSTAIVGRVLPLLLRESTGAGLYRIFVTLDQSLIFKFVHHCKGPSIEGILLFMRGPIRCRHVFSTVHLM